jgi:hypothetical protein
VCLCGVISSNKQDHSAEQGRNSCCKCSWASDGVHVQLVSLGGWLHAVWVTFVHTLAIILRGLGLLGSSQHQLLGAV